MKRIIFTLSILLLAACYDTTTEPQNMPTPILVVEKVNEVAEDCILTQKGHVEGQLFWERTGELSGDGQMVNPSPMEPLSRPH